MGAQLGSAAEESGPISDINVTPFVDVVLVLLVIFIITAPMIMKDTISIHLPKASTADAQSPTSLGIAINSQVQVLLNCLPVGLSDLSREASKELNSNPNIQAIISADKDARHGDV